MWPIKLKLSQFYLQYLIGTHFHLLYHEDTKGVSSSPGMNCSVLSSCPPPTPPQHSGCQFPHVTPDWDKYSASNVTIQANEDVIVEILPLIVSVTDKWTWLTRHLFSFTSDAVKSFFFFFILLKIKTYILFTFRTIFYEFEYRVAMVLSIDHWKLFARSNHVALFY